ncbi:MAG: hypothetical protein N4A43_00645 [Alphaproteobacteria bacterium]|jgi:hypothetical protein|nr:hypothetical protein [Alphaproteobacteria bacterium]
MEGNLNKESKADSDIILELKTGIIKAEITSNKSLKNSLKQSIKSNFWRKGFFKVEFNVDEKLTETEVAKKINISRHKVVYEGNSVFLSAALN